jgi:hypothetical protein
MAVDWELVLASLVPVVVGFAIGFLLTPLSDTWSNRRRRRKFAAVLACEVEAIRAMATHSIQVNTPSVEDTRKTLETAGPGLVSLASVAVDDTDYPTKVFESSLGEVGNLGGDVMLKLTELYRWVEYTHHMKRQNLQSHAEFMEVWKAASGRGSGPTLEERDVMGNASMGSVTFATQYLKNQARVVELAAPVVADLERIGKVSVAGKVSVSTGEPLRASTLRR